MKRFCLAILFLCLIVGFGLLPTADAARKTRDLVFDHDDNPPQSAPDKQAVVGVKLQLELQRNGQTSYVTPSYHFQSGDKVRFIYTTNIDCYVYWLQEGSSGRYTMLFPNPKVGMDNWVKKNEPHTIPVKGAFRFDQTPGTEKILLVMSPQKIPELEAASQEAAQHEGQVDFHAVGVTTVANNTIAKRKTRDLVFDEKEDQQTGISTQLQVSADIKQPFVTIFNLVHK